MDDLGAVVSNNYSNGKLWDLIQEAMKQEGLDTKALTIHELAPLDHFHTGGINATRELAALVNIKEEHKILDVGSGLGGVARFLAAEHGCSVSGVDLTEEFCQVATRLSQLVHLDNLIDFRQGDATILPFEEGCFHQVWTLQAQMNIKDKQKFYAEIFRVLLPGGKFVFQDIMAGSAGDIHLPVPWATRPDISFLISVDELSVLLEEIGFQVESLQDFSQNALQMRRKSQSVEGGKPAPLGLHLVMGADTGVKMGNQTRNLEEDRVAYVRGVLIKPL